MCIDRRLLFSVALLLTTSAIARTHAPLPESSDWIIKPDPPEIGKDLEVTYSAEIPISEEAAYRIDDGPMVRVKIVKTPTFTIPASKLKGKSALRLWGYDSLEGGYRLVKLPRGR